MEVVEHKRLVYIETVSDESGGVLSATKMGLLEGHPTMSEVIVELEDLVGRTRMVLTHRGIPGGSPGAAGWKLAFDRLGTLIKERS